MVEKSSVDAMGPTDMAVASVVVAAVGATSMCHMVPNPLPLRLDEKACPYIAVELNVLTGDEDVVLWLYY
jgi:hypothetical protein